MKKYSAENIRNVAILGHSGAGKTSFCEAVLYKSGVVDRPGKSNDGNTVLDFDDEEKKRHISINTSVASCVWEDTKVNLIDTPGDFDFLGEVVQALRVADCGIVVLSAKDGVTVGAEKSVRFLQRQDIPFAIFVNKMDEASADFMKTMADIRNHFGRDCTIMMIPIQEENKYLGYIDVINRKAYLYNDKGERYETAVPENYQEDLDLQYNNLMEQVAESDEELMEKYFAEEPFTREEISRGLHDRIGGGYMIPVWTGSALELKGIRFMMNRIVDHMPSAAAHRAVNAVKKDGSALSLSADPKGPLAAFVFKTLADPFVGKISLFRIYSGTLSQNQTVWNANREKEERIGGLSFVQGKNQLAQDSIEAGDIGAITKLGFTMTGDTLSVKEQPLILPRIVYPAAPLRMAIAPTAKGEEEKIAAGLARLQEEDPTFSFGNDPETKEMVINGLGELQLDVLRSKLKNKFKVDSVLKTPRIPYRETIRKKVKVQGKHKKQSGGHGQYGDVWVEFEPCDADGLVFEEKVFGGSVPRAYYPAVEKGLQESVESGVLAGYPVVGVKAILVDGSYHDVDSSELAFKIAASLAFKAGMQQAGSVLMEPIYAVEIHVPEEEMGNIMSDINKRRGRIQGIDSKSGMSVVNAEIPLSEMLRYATDLRAMTQGRGWYDMSFVRYEEMLPQMAERVIADSKREE